MQCCPLVINLYYCTLIYSHHKKVVYYYYHYCLIEQTILINLIFIFTLSDTCLESAIILLQHIKKAHPIVTDCTVHISTKSQKEHTPHLQKLLINSHFLFSHVASHIEYRPNKISANYPFFV